MVAPTADVGAKRDSRVHALRALLLAGLCVEFTFALVARGGFFPPDGTIVLIWSLGLLSISYFLASDRHSIRAEEVVVLFLAVWWLVTARLHGVAGSFQPMGASIVSFVAAAAVVRQTPWLWRRNGALVGIALSAATGVVGLIACDLRWYPLAMRGQDLWRLSGTVTYSNATGLLLGMGLLLAMDRTMHTRWSSFAIAACAAGLVATQSRSAVLATLVAFAWLARREFRAELVPLAAGAFAGIVTVASSNGDAGRPLALCVSLLALALAPTVTERMQRSSEHWSTRTHRVATAAWAIGAAVLLGALIGARSEALKRIDVGSDLGRLHEWRAALQQFHTSIWTGVGPDQLLVLSKETSTYFAHNEYLQLLAGGGLIALCLLATAVVLIVRRQRSCPVHVRTACGALIVFALAGLFDYSWHVPAIALLAGMMLGLAQPDAEIPARVMIEPGQLGSENGWSDETFVPPAPPLDRPATFPRGPTLGGGETCSKLPPRSKGGSMRSRARLPQSLAVALLVAGVIAGASLAGATTPTVHVTPIVNQLATIPSGGQIAGVTCTSSAHCVAVGRDLNSAPLTLSGAASAWGTSDAKQISLGSTYGGSGGLVSIACTSASMCVAVGYNYDSDHVVVLHGNPATWGAAQARQIVLGSAFGSTGSLASVTCTSSTACVAVGYDGHSQPLALAGNPATWGAAQAREITLGSGFGSGGVLTSVTCTSSTQCVAAGRDSASQPVVVSGNPATWTVAQATQITLGSGFSDGGALNSVSCTSSSQCVAVGYDNSGQLLTLDGNPATWSATQATSIALVSSEGGGGLLNSVSCTGSTSCTAVGDDYKSQLLVLTGDPATWGSPQTRAIALGASFGSGGTLTSIDCSLSASCVAGGSDFSDSPLELSGNPTTWNASHVHVVVLRGAEFGAVEALTSLTCESKAVCVALGLGLSDEPFMLRGNPAAWGSAKARELELGAAVGGGGSLHSMSCMTPTSCVAVGTDRKGQPFTLRGNPATWTGPMAKQLTLASSMGSGGSLTSVSCATPTLCVAVGSDAKGLPLVLRGNPAAWRAGLAKQIVLGTAFDNGGHLSSIHCTSATACVAVGASNKGEPLEFHGNPASWSPANARQLTLGTAFGKGGSLSSVTCASATSCIAVGEDDDSVPLVVTGNPVSWRVGDAAHVRITTAPGTVEGFSSLIRSVDGSLDGVSCASIASCAAIGFDQDGGPILASGSPAAVAHGAAGRPHELASFVDGSFDAVGCVAGECFVVGVNRSASNDERTAFIARI